MDVGRQVRRPILIKDGRARLPAAVHDRYTYITQTRPACPVDPRIDSQLSLCAFDQCDDQQWQWQRDPVRCDLDRPMATAPLLVETATPDLMCVLVKITTLPSSCEEDLAPVIAHTVSCLLAFPCLVPAQHASCHELLGCMPEPQSVVTPAATECRLPSPQSPRSSALRTDRISIPSLPLAFLGHPRSVTRRLAGFGRSSHTS